jgi:hypothetical protein
MTQPSSGVEPGDSAHEEHGEHAEHADHEEHESHGHSTAAWSGVGIILVGAVVMALAVVFAWVGWFIVGAVIVVVGILSGKVLAMAGYGDKASTSEAADQAGGRGAELPGRSQEDSGTQ